MIHSIYIICLPVAHSKRFMQIIKVILQAEEADFDACLSVCYSSQLPSGNLPLRPTALGDVSSADGGGNICMEADLLASEVHHLLMYPGHASGSLLCMEQNFWNARRCASANG